MPFVYPSNSHTRRHGPVYDSLPPYRDWLRDDFTFRCVYCLDRECWGRVIGHYDIEHWAPQVRNPALGLDYDNLFYACHACNLVKGPNPIPDPGEFLTANSARVDPIDGSITGLTTEAQHIIDVLALNSQGTCDWRQIMMRSIDLAKEHDPKHFLRLMGFPSELPNLAEKDPNYNSRPGGIEQSWFAKSGRGELPETY